MLGKNVRKDVKKRYERQDVRKEAWKDVSKDFRKDARKDVRKDVRKDIKDATHLLHNKCPRFSSTSACPQPSLPGLTTVCHHTQNTLHTLLHRLCRSSPSLYNEVYTIKRYNIKLKIIN